MWKVIETKVILITPNEKLARKIAADNRKRVNKEKANDVVNYELYEVPDGPK